MLFQYLSKSKSKPLFCYSSKSKRVTPHKVSQLKTNKQHSFYGPYPLIRYNPGVTPGEPSDGSIPFSQVKQETSQSQMKINHF